MLYKKDTYGNNDVKLSQFTRYDDDSIYNGLFPLKFTRLPARRTIVNLLNSSNYRIREISFNNLYFSLQFIYYLNLYNVTDLKH